MNIVRLRDGLVSLLIGGFLAWYIWFQVISRTYGYVTSEPPPHWKNSAIWMLSHMIGGMSALAIGPIQFLPAIRNRYPSLHRALGKTYIVMSLLSITALYARILPVGYCTACLPSTYIVTSLWLMSIIAAYLSIRAGDVTIHMAFMMRSYVFASYFLLARYFIPTFEGLFKPAESEDYFMLVTDFLCWLIPWIALEVGLFTWRYRRVRRGEISS